MRPLVLLFALSVAASAGCTPAPPPGDWATVEDATPLFLAGTSGADASVAADAHGRVALTWVTRDTLGATDLWLSVSTDSGTTFAPPQRVNLQPGRVASYPESRPVAAYGPAGRLLVVWSTARDSGAYASDIVARSSRDGGRSLGPEQLLNDEAGDARSPYHGFAAADWLSDGRAIVAWIDGRGTQLAPGEDEPHTAEIFMDVSADGGESWGTDRRVAGQVCPCCRLSLRAQGASAVALAYRGATGDLRDPRLAWSGDGGVTWRLDSLVSRDAWLLSGCPSIGPVTTLAREGRSGHYAWFTGADAGAGVRTLDWRMAGDSAFTWGAPVLHADSLREPTRPMLADAEGAPVLGVLARGTHADSPRLLALRPLGGASRRDWLRLGSGVRSAALAPARGTAVWAAWTEDAGEGPRVRLARVRPRP